VRSSAVARGREKRVVKAAVERARKRIVVDLVKVDRLFGVYVDGD